MMNNKTRPGDMVRIAGGHVLYPNNQRAKVAGDFYIDLYPITNKQYRTFLEQHPEISVPYCSPGLGTQSYNWNRETRTFPAGKGDHPVVLVGREGADGYCEWRSRNDKEGRQFDLPTRNEWVAAAGGDGRIYPWGDQFNQDKCNTFESHLHSTTSVFKYPTGVSPHGCWDMAGNVWERTKDNYILGGCWSLDRDCARLDFDRWDALSPDVWDINIGFRCVARIGID